MEGRTQLNDLKRPEARGTSIPCSSPWFVELEKVECRDEATDTFLLNKTLGLLRCLAYEVSLFISQSLSPLLDLEVFFNVTLVLPYSCVAWISSRFLHSRCISGSLSLRNAFSCFVFAFSIRKDSFLNSAFSPAFLVSKYLAHFFDKVISGKPL